MTPPAREARLTVGNSLPAVRNLAQEMRRAVQEAGQLTASRMLLADLDNVVNYLDASNTEIDVTIETGIRGHEAALLERWLAPDAREGSLSLTRAAGIPSYVETRDPQATRNVRLNLSTLQTVVDLRPVAVRAPLGICALRSEESIHEPLCERLMCFLEGRPIAIIIAPWREPWTRRLKVLAEEKAWVVERLDFESLPQSLPQRLITRPWPELFNLCRAQVGVVCVAAAEKVMGAVIADETRGLRVRQAMVQQRVTLVQRSPVPNANELLGQVRTRLQRQFAEFERGIGERVSRTLSPAAGSLWGDVEDQLGELDHLEWVGESAGNRVQIPQAFERNLTQLVTGTLRRQAEQDIQALHDLMDMLVAEINQLLTNAGMPQNDLEYRTLTAGNFDRVFGRVRLDRIYRGDLPRPGVDEYLNIVRRNYVVFSLLSVLGVTSLFSRISGTLRLVILAAFVPVAGFLLRRSVMTARRESTEREVDRAREILRAELRRILGEVERGWPSVIAEYFREHFSAWTTEIDVFIRDHVRHVGENVAEEKVRVQRQLQTVETSNRQLQAAAKRREAVGTAATKLISEIRSIFDGISENMHRATQ